MKLKQPNNNKRAGWRAHGFNSAKWSLFKTMCIWLRPNDKGPASIKNHNYSLRRKNSSTSTKFKLGGDRFPPKRAAYSDGVHPLYGGILGLAIVQTPVLPIPSYPALYLEDTTHSWTRDDPRYCPRRRSHTTTGQIPDRTQHAPR